MNIDLNQPIPTWAQLKKEKPSQKYALCVPSKGLIITEVTYSKKTYQISLIDLQSSLSRKKKQVICCFVVYQQGYGKLHQLTAIGKLLTFLNNTDKESNLKYCLDRLPEKVFGNFLWQCFYRLVKEIEFHVDV